MAVSISGGNGADTIGGLRPSLHLRAEDESAIVFASSPSAALIPALLAACFGGSLAMAPASPGSIIFALIAAGLSLWAISSLLWRERLTLDLERRRYIHDTGFWPWLTTAEGALGDIKAIALDVVLHTGSKGGEYRSWKVSLLFGDAAKSIFIADFRMEQDAYSRVADLARRAGLSALDRSESPVRAIPAAEVDQPLLRRHDAPSEIHPCRQRASSPSSARPGSGASCCRWRELACSPSCFL